MPRSKALPSVLLLLMSAVAAQAEPFSPPASPRQTLNFNPDWKFIRQDAPGAENPAFDDSAWSMVSTPHTYNDVDTFTKLISHSGGQQGAYMGIAWYRKHFKLPAGLEGRKLLLEFEGMRQAGRIYLNGKELALEENGITAFGVDLTNAALFGDRENVLAVRIDNTTTYKEEKSGTVFQWESKDFNPNYGGITKRVWLHVSGRIYQTLPVYEGLQTTGTYVYAGDISVPNRTATVNIETQVANESGDQTPVTLSAVVVDQRGGVVAKIDGDTVDMVQGEKSILKASGQLAAVRFWSPEQAALYDVYTILTADGKVVDVKKTTTGFRKTEYKGGAGTGGVYLNDKFTWLTGYAQRATNEWAGLGQAYPDWMHDFNARLIRESNANYVRWMHISPQKVDVEAFDRAGIVEVCPAGDKEKDVTGAQWDQRLAVMRDSMIYYRNHPSILFWEAGNSGITADHMKQMVELKAQWDPSGGRAMGCRTLNDPEAQPEYFGVMIGQDDGKDKRKTNSDLFRAFSWDRRDKAPFIETEDFRDEGARRFWDDFSPPHFGFKQGPADTYAWNSETFALAAAVRYNAYWSNRIENTDPQHAKWAAYASIYWSDSNADGRQQSSEVCRVSGKVDAVRLPKEIFYASQVMQGRKPQVHILGHWNYPAGTKKTIYVFSNTKSVELQLNGQTLGRADRPIDLSFDKAGKAIAGKGEPTGFVFTFTDVAYEPGTLRALGYNLAGSPAAQDQRTTVGAATALKLTPHVGPKGLQADGQDVAFFDVEVVDALGQRCPTDESRVDFEVSGPCTWRGGYNSGILDSVNNRYLLTECGINRVSIRAGRQPGTITLTARRAGLSAATVKVESVAFPVKDGLSQELPAREP